MSFQKIITSEVFKYLFFGVLATFVYIFIRFLTFFLTKEATSSALLANIGAIIFAFVTNDSFVFNQVKIGRFKRFVKFVIARLFTLILDVLLAYFLVEKFPLLIGQFVNNDINMINTIETLLGQFMVITLNYILSKLFIFKDTK